MGREGRVVLGVGGGVEGCFEEGRGGLEVWF